MGTRSLSTMMSIQPTVLVSNRSELPQFERVTPASVDFQAMLMENVAYKVRSLKTKSCCIKNRLYVYSLHYNT